MDSATATLSMMSGTGDVIAVFNPYSAITTAQ